MVWIAPEWQAHQRQRFTRPDAQRYWRPDASRWISADAQRLLGRDIETADAAQPPGRAYAEPPEPDAAQQAERAELLALQSLVAELKWQLALRRFARKYREDQPRDDRGRWTEGAAGGAATRETATDVSAQRRAGGIGRKLWGLTAREFVSRYCEGKINREHPANSRI